jgi:hypothetical protein
MLRPAYPAMTAQQQEVIKRYTGELIVKVVETVSTAMAKLAPASLAFGQGEAGFGVNRRRVSLRQLPGPVDPDVPMLSVRDPGGQLRAVLFGYRMLAAQPYQRSLSLRVIENALVLAATGPYPARLGRGPSLLQSARVSSRLDGTSDIIAVGELAICDPLPLQG